MSHDPVFEFSEHFDVKFLQQVFENNIHYAKDLFSLFLQGTEERLQYVQQLLDAEDWYNASYRIHRFKADFFMAGLSRQGKVLQEIENALKCQDFDAATIVADFRRVHLEVLAMYPLVRAEIDRMNVYLSHPWRQP